jgi:DNA-directed RNA polymerase specialized sigma24 family protein
MARAGEAFESTRWSVIAQAAATGDPKAREAMARLVTSYWKPLFAFLRRRGLGDDEAADTVQGLFTELLENDRMRQVDRGRGRFRTWLLSALLFHLSHERERAHAIKRGGDRRVESIDRLDPEQYRSLPGPSSELDPQRVYDRTWAIEVLDRALARLAHRCSLERKTDLFDALKPALIGAEGAPHLAEIADRLGMTKGAAKIAAFRLRVGLREAIRAEVLATLDESDDLEDEIRSLFRALSRSP